MVKKSLKYPFENKKEWLLLGVVFCIIELFNGIAETLVSTELAGVIKFISLLIAVFVAGYEVSVIHHAIHELEGAPSFNWKKSLIEGFRSKVFYILYLMIPVVIIYFVAFITGLGKNIGIVTTAIKTHKYLSTVIANQGLSDAFKISQLSTIVPMDVINSLITGLIITSIVALVVIFLFVMFSVIGHIISDTHGFKHGFNHKLIFEKIGNIGWGKMLLWYISLIIIAFALLILATIIAEILPFEIGVYIDMLFIISYIFMAGFHYVGMIYTEAESESE